MPLTLLLCSTDKTLSLTRELLFLKSGYRVITVLNVAGAIDLMIHRQFDGIVLCQSLATKDCEAILAAASNLPSPVKTIVITDLHPDPPSITHAAAVIPPLLSPGILLNLIKETFVLPGVSFL